MASSCAFGFELINTLTLAYHARVVDHKAIGREDPFWFPFGIARQLVLEWWESILLFVLGDFPFNTNRSFVTTCI